MQTPDILKFVLLGDKGIGKRTILSTGFGKPQRFSSLYLPIEFVEISVRSRNRNWNAVCYDSLVSTSSVNKNEAAAIETFTATAVNGADAVLFCYAADDANSFRSLNRWYKDVAVHLSPNTLIYLVETKGDLPNKVNESDEKDFTSHVKFQNHFKINGHNREHVMNLFSTIIEKVEGIRDFNQSQRLDKTSTYKSPQKKVTNGPLQDVRYSDKKEKIVLMEGSYIKKLSVVESKRTLSDSTQRLQQKNLKDDELKDEHF